MPSSSVELAFEIQKRYDPLVSVGVCKLVMTCVFIFSGISKPNVPQWREAAAFCSHPFIEYRLKLKCNSAKFPLDVSLNVF